MDHSRTDLHIQCGNLMMASTTSSICFMVVCCSLQRTLAATMIFYCTFLRLMVLGPLTEAIVAGYPNTVWPPLGRLIRAFLIFSILFQNLFFEAHHKIKILLSFVDFVYFLPGKSNIHLFHQIAHGHSVGGQTLICWSTATSASPSMLWIFSASPCRVGTAVSNWNQKF